DLETKEIPTGRVRNVQCDQPFELALPDLFEIPGLLLDALRVTTPAREDVELLPVAPPPGLGLVDAPDEGDPIARRVADQPRLFVEDPVDRDRATVVVARDRDLHLEDAVGDEPRSEEHTSELQSRENLVCRLLL